MNIKAHEIKKIILTVKLIFHYQVRQKKIFFLFENKRK